MWIPPHSSDQVQPLDLLGFNLQKFVSSRVHRNKHYTAQTNAILRIIEGVQQISTSSRIMGAWHRAGIYKQRPLNTENADNIKQLHRIDIDANGNIRHKIIEENENVTMLTSTDTTISYVKVPPDELYPKTKRVGIPGMTYKLAYSELEDAEESMKNPENQHSERHDSPAIDSDPTSLLENKDPSKSPIEDETVSVSTDRNAFDCNLNKEFVVLRPGQARPETFERDGIRRTLYF